MVEVLFNMVHKSVLCDEGEWEIFWVYFIEKYQVYDLFITILIKNMRGIFIIDITYIEKLVKR